MHTGGGVTGSLAFSFRARMRCTSSASIQPMRSEISAAIIVPAATASPCSQVPYPAAPAITRHAHSHVQTVGHTAVLHSASTALAPCWQAERRPEHVSMAWPKVWPKLRVARKPPSRSSAATTSALLTHDLSIAYVNACEAGSASTPQHTKPHHSSGYAHSRPASLCVAATATQQQATSTSGSRCSKRSMFCSNHSNSGASRINPYFIISALFVSRQRQRN